LASTTAWALLAVSSSPQELSLDDQALWAQEAAAANDWAILRTFRGVSSGNTGTRKLVDTLLLELQATPKADRPKRLLMVRLDRLGRGTGIEVMAAIAEIRKLGCSIYTRDIGLVSINQASDVFRPMLDAITAAIENEKRSDRAKAGKARRRAAGLHNGNAPYGCIIVEGRAIAHEPEASLVRAIFERRARGWGYERLAKYAGGSAPLKTLRNGKTRKMLWGRSSISGLLVCRTLRGTAVPDELWDEANAVANLDFKTLKRTSWPYPLQGAIRCTCGMLLSGQCAKGERYYVCRRVAEHGYYPHWRAVRAEEAFGAFLVRLSTDPRILEPQEPQADLNALRAQERAALDALEATENKRRQIWGMADSLSGSQLRERLDEIDRERAHGANALQSIRGEIRTSEEHSDRIQPFIDSLRRLAEDWPSATLDLQQEAARAVVAVVEGLYLQPMPKLAPKERRRGHGDTVEMLMGLEM
jgi:DNA invertase Pin-like site-specific DNA recombinase